MLVMEPVSIDFPETINARVSHSFFQKAFFMTT